MAIRVRADGRAAVLRETEFVIGRSSYCSLVLDHASVSRLHASIRRAGDHFEISDLGSRNGTFVNNRRITRSTHVAIGDAIRLGDLPVVLEEISERPLSSTVTRDDAPVTVLPDDTTRVPIERRR